MRMRDGEPIMPDELARQEALLRQISAAEEMTDGGLIEMDIREPDSETASRKLGNFGITEALQPEGEKNE